MYEERRETFSVKDFLFHLLIVVLVIAFIVCLFPVGKYIKNLFTKKDDNPEMVLASDAELERLTSLYGKEFSDNVASMKDAAIRYYTNDKLPTEVGDTSTLTLAEMYEKHLVLGLNDRDGEACDKEKSYISMTKSKEDYQLKINLYCDSDEDYIIVYLSSYDYCDQGTICELQVVKEPDVEEHPSDEVETPEDNPNSPDDDSPTMNNSCEYMITTDGSWSDYGEWSEWTETKIISSDAVEVETKVEKRLNKNYKKKVKVGTKTEQYIKDYVTEEYIADYKLEKDIVDYTIEKYIIDYTSDNRPVYATRKVPVYATRKVPIYAKRKVPVYAQREVPIYKEVVVPTYENVTFYRSRKREYIAGSAEARWSTCDPVDTALTSQGYVLTGKKKEA